MAMHLLTTPPQKHSIHEQQQTKKLVFQSSTNLRDLTSTTAPYRINKFIYSTPKKTTTFFNSTKRILSNNLTAPYFVFIGEQHITITVSCCHSTKLKYNNFNNSTKLGYSSQDSTNKKIIIFTNVKQYDFVTAPNVIVYFLTALKQKLNFLTAPYKENSIQSSIKS